MNRCLLLAVLLSGCTTGAAKQVPTEPAPPATPPPVTEPRCTSSEDCGGLGQLCVDGTCRGCMAGGAPTLKHAS